MSKHGQRIARTKSCGSRLEIFEYLKLFLLIESKKP